MRNFLTLLLLVFAGTASASDATTETSPCPGLVSSYDVEKFERALVVTDAEFTSIEDCEQLGAFFFMLSRSQERAMDYARLAAIVDEIWQPVNEDAPFVLLEAILSWLKGLGFDRHAESLRDFFDEYMPANESIQLFFTAVIWLIATATVALVVHEFYRAGLLRLPAGRRRRDDRAAPVDSNAMQWEDILALPLRERISALLRYSIEILAAARLIPASHSYTNRELLACLEKSDAHKAGLLRKQLELTEPVIYGDEHITEERIAACQAKSRELGDA